ncbi:inorganic phosphate transporter 1-4 /Pi cotransporter [Lophiostoma macrostomum CBS 122681]|uniref:Inorganic phosphate transporter 1-4 /Pi cotransporter n=1 Tax=Lophiostoma macrostomum CBS 122681 TaxID=1314788 RepID=A0A6A6SP12_9PLEO|nr:inorganic phosphate transporter 1-4 /Pi cotransporter [Lophiostoma macrostomum CBS 122681]
MGVRKWVSRPMKGRKMGIEDLMRGDEGLPESKRRKWALQTIDEAPFQIWVVIVAGVGFLTDAFDIFALNVVTPMLGYVYWPENRDKDNGVPEVPKAVGTAMLCATLAGTMIGQVAFGFAADVLGRRKMYGLELVIVIAGTMLMILSSNGERNSMAIGGWLITWRVVMGLGIGADYPLSAVITSEFAPRKYRARMLSWVFFAQPIGQLLANLLSFAAVAAFQGQITRDAKYCTDDSCIRAVDRLWRLVVGIGIIPAVIALAFRFTIPESPRYKLDVLRNGKAVIEDTQDYYGGPQVDAEGGEMDMLGADHVARSATRLSFSSSDIAPDQVIDSDGEDDAVAAGEYTRDSSPQTMQLHPTDPMFVPPLASRKDARRYFIDEGNWLYLLGTSLSWFFLDFAFYGLGLSSPEIVRHIWKDPKFDTRFVYDSLHDNSLELLIMISIGATIGGAAMIKVIKYASPKVIQFWGFVALFALFVVTGAAWPRLLGNATYSVGLIVLYVLCQIAFNLGPNVTTFIIPAEIFPTRYRCTCHGISAAAGKFGSWIAQIFLAYTHWAREDFGYVLLVMSAFMMAGAVTTHFLVPETRDHDNKSRTLEVLAGGRVVLEELNRQRAREDD